MTVFQHTLQQVSKQLSESLSVHEGANQRELVLASNPPPVNRDAIDHTGLGPNLNTAERVATPTASTASPTAVPDGPGGSDPGFSTNAHRLKNPAISTARARNRRNHPRTVAVGTPSRPAIGRWPSPPA